MIEGQTVQTPAGRSLLPDLIVADWSVSIARVDDIVRVDIRCNHLAAFEIDTSEMAKDYEMLQLAHECIDIDGVAERAQLDIGVLVVFPERLHPERLELVVCQACVHLVRIASVVSLDAWLDLWLSMLAI